MPNFKALKENEAIPRMLKLREVGMEGRFNFSPGDRYIINQRFIPNKMNIMDLHRGKLFCGMFAKNGNIFICAACELPRRFIRLYDTKNGGFRLMKSVEDCGDGVLDTDMSPDGLHFIYSCWSRSIYICNVFGEHNIHESLPLNPYRGNFGVFSVRFSHDGREILCGANDQCFYVYNREENQRTLKIPCHYDNINTVAFADNTSQILFTGGDDGICKKYAGEILSPKCSLESILYNRHILSQKLESDKLVWDRRALCEASPTPVGIFLGHEGGITYIDPKGDSRHLITNSKDQTIKLWDMRAFSPSAAIKDFKERIAFRKYLCRSPGFHLTSIPARARLFGDTSLMSYVGHNVSHSMIRCRFSPQSTTSKYYIYSGCAQGRIIVYSVLTGKIKKILFGHNGCVCDISWHPYRNEIVSSGFDGIIAKWTYFGDTEEHDFNSD